AESVKKADAIENITLVKEFVLAEVVKQMVVGDGEGEESDSYDTFLLNQEDLDIRLESRSHKESPEKMVNVRGEHRLKPEPNRKNQTRPRLFYPKTMDYVRSSPVWDGPVLRSVRSKKELLVGCT
ncbi:hypothetical protein Tco_0263370, partial [Tanacetum coccineum]